MLWFDLTLCSCMCFRKSTICIANCFQMTLGRLICWKPSWNSYCLQSLLFYHLLCWCALQLDRLFHPHWQLLGKINLQSHSPFLDTVPPDTQVISSSSFLSVFNWFSSNSTSCLFGQISNLLLFQDLLSFYHFTCWLDTFLLFY